MICNFFPTPSILSMRKLSVLTCLSALTFILLSAEDDTAAPSELPTEAALMIERLENWEENQERMYLQSVEKKRDEVAKVLDGILQEFTRQGKLAEALVIDKEIKKLRSPLIAAKTEEKKQPPSDPHWFVGETWEQVTRNEDTFTFQEDGTGTRFFKGDEYSFAWTLEGELVVMKFDYLTLYATLERRGESVIARSEDGATDPIPVRLRR